MGKRKLDEATRRQMHQRKLGRISRRIREPNALSEAQRKLAQDLADRYDLPEEKAATYLDWYAAIHYRWISTEQAERETGQTLFTTNADTPTS